ncbi:MAG TPA: CHAT domain-containing protein, partial [Thermoanaerobaculia bacterium]|nr:CHAT domain-containing protein [Thermoanaerobaculia bacterium]
MSDSPHPQPEILGAFHDGLLDAGERGAVVEHLAVCDLCVGFIRGARLAAQETEAAPAPAPLPFNRRRWLLAAAAVVVPMLAAGSYYLLRGDRAGGVQTLIAASPETYRTIEPRLTGFRWAQLRRIRADAEAPPDAEGLKLAGAAGDVLARARDDDSAVARRAVGVASLLVNDTVRATEALQRATSSDPENAAAWNDLAAALYTSAVRDRRAADLPEALAAAERALRRDPEFPEARFNRALILEQMGLRTEAAGAWRDYLAVDASSKWAEEARLRLNALPPATQTRFRDRIPVLESAAVAGDAVRVGAILREFPQEVRAWFETDVLGRWGEATVRGDTVAAAAFLASAHTAGEVLHNASGERLLADAVRAIDRANAGRRNALAGAHAGYRAGRLAYRDGKLEEAERMLLGAAGAFDAEANPMGNLARTYAAAVVFDQNRIAEAAALLDPVIADTDPSHLALHAQASLFLGRCAAYACQWSEAMRHFTAARSGYARLHEPSNLAESENALGEVYANAGEVELAWQHRLEALRIFGNGTNGRRLLAALATNARGELRNGRWSSAEALLRLEIAEAHRAGDPLLIADAHKRRAMLHAQRGDSEAAYADLREARDHASRAASSGLRTRLDAECLLVEGIAARARDAVRSLAALTGAVEFALASGDRRLLPEALLERARTHRAAGRQDEAWSDLEAGIDEVEDRRGMAAGGPGATRDAAGALFDEAIELLLVRGRHERAFEYADRGHARALLDAMGPGVRMEVRVSSIAAELPADAAFVQYALLPDRVAIFRITRDGLRVAQHPVGRASLESDVRALRARIEEHAELGELRSASARVDAALVAPLRALGRARSLVIVGNRVVQSVPWAALWNPDRREYLIEQSALSVAPSAGVWLTIRARHAGRRRGDRLLLVTSDARASLDPLNELRREREGLQALYARHTLLVDSEATPARFLDDAGAADIVHYGGHARAASGVAEAALLLAGDYELRASQIARSSLVGPQLVVLAACDTMTSGATGLEGAPDLARGFLAAGVPTVLGTLWRINDAD